MTLDSVLKKLTAEIEAAGGQRPWARENHISQAYVNQVLKGVAAPGAKLLEALGLRRVTSYEKV